MFVAASGVKAPQLSDTKAFSINTDTARLEYHNIFSSLRQCNQTFKKMQPANTIEQELQYRNKVQTLLRKHASFIHHRPSSADESPSSETMQQYAPEQRLVDRIVSNERTAFMYGIALSGIVFASVRFGPRYLAVKIGGREKERA